MTFGACENFTPEASSRLQKRWNFQNVTFVRLEAAMDSGYIAGRALSVIAESVLGQAPGTERRRAYRQWPGLSPRSTPPGLAGNYQYFVILSGVPVGTVTGNAFVCYGVTIL